MIHRIALLIGTVAAIAVLAAGVVAARSGSIPMTSTEVAKAGDQSQATAPTTRTVTDTIYVRPAPSPEVIHVTRHDRPATTPAPRTTVRHSGHGGEDEDEGHDGEGEGHGGGDDGRGGDD